MSRIHFLREMIERRLAEYFLQLQETVSSPVLFSWPLKNLAVLLETLVVKAISVIQGMDRVHLDAYQLRRINKILSRMEPRRSIHALSDLFSFPITGKQYMRDFFSTFPEKKLKNFFLVATSGSTDLPVRFHLSNKILLRRSSAIHHVMKIVGVPCHSRIFRVNFNHLPFYKHQSLYIPARDMYQMPYEEVVKKISSYDPRVLFGTASDLILFSKFVEKNSLQCRFLAVFVMGEFLSPNQRSYFENLFKADTFSIYGASEFGIIGQECREKNGIHINEDLVRVEIVREGTSVEASRGVPGNIVITSLYNTDPPLVRYSVGDVGRVAEEPCPCGLRSLKILFEGREREFITLSNDKKIPLFGIIASMMRVRKILLYQFEQPSAGELKVKVVLSDTIDEQEVLKKIENIISESLNADGNTVRVTIQSVAIDVVSRFGSNGKTIVLTQSKKGL